jgi:WD40 repeat protein
MRPLRTSIFSIVLLGVFFAVFRAKADLPDFYVSDGFNVDLFDGTNLNTNFISIDQAGGLAFGPNGTLYAASTGDGQVYSYNPTTGALTGTFVPYFGSTDPRSVQQPTGMAWGPDGNLYVADVTGSNVHIYSNTGASISSIGSADLGQPTNVAFDHSAQLYAADNNGIERYSGSQFVPYIPAISGGGSYVLNNASSIAFSSAGDAYVLDISGASAGILKFTGTTFDSKIVDFSTSNFTPANLIIGPDGRIYVSGSDAIGGGEVLSYNLNGIGGSVFVSGLSNPTYMAFAAPEPTTGLLVFLGLGLAGISRWRRRSLA